MQTKHIQKGFVIRIRYYKSFVRKTLLFRLQSNAVVAFHCNVAKLGQISFGGYGYSPHPLFFAIIFFKIFSNFACEINLVALGMRRKRKRLLAVFSFPFPYLFIAQSDDVQIAGVQLFHSHLLLYFCRTRTRNIHMTFP